jgi:Holliday junction resolvase RusA-like endonuclease
MMPVSSCTIRVIGTPAPQGSKSFKGKSKAGHAIMVESCKAVKPWREAVVYAARECGCRVDGPVTARIWFTVPKPKSAPRKRVTYPDRKPDLDKLTRSTFDALKTAGVIEDDARIIRLVAMKLYPDEGMGALDVPGAVIEINEVSE